MYALLFSIWHWHLGGVARTANRWGKSTSATCTVSASVWPGRTRSRATLAKYCGKEMQCRALDQKRYFRSRGIVVPDVDVWRVPFCTNMLHAAQVAFQALSGHCMDGLQTWCNNNLGVVYLATAPGLPQD